VHQFFVPLVRAPEFLFIVVLGLALYNRCKSLAHIVVAVALLASRAANVMAVAHGRSSRKCLWQYQLECKMGTSFRVILWMAGDATMWCAWSR